MRTRRRFLLASSLVRLILRERGGQHTIEGYFPERNGRSSSVSLDGRSARLVLTSHHHEGAVEEPVEIPAAQAEALLAAAAGAVEYLRAALPLDHREVHIIRFVTPGPLEVVDVLFEHEREVHAFQPPAWFGPEVSTDRRFDNRALALAGLTVAPEVPLTNTALNSLLDALERCGTAISPQPSPVPAERLVRAS